MSRIESGSPSLTLSDLQRADSASQPNVDQNVDRDSKASFELVEKTDPPKRTRGMLRFMKDLISNPKKEIPNLFKRAAPGNSDAPPSARFARHTDIQSGSSLMTFEKPMVAGGTGDRDSTAFNPDRAAINPGKVDFSKVPLEWAMDDMSEPDFNMGDADSMRLSNFFRASDEQVGPAPLTRSPLLRVKSQPNPERTYPGFFGPSINQLDVQAIGLMNESPTLMNQVQRLGSDGWSLEISNDPEERGGTFQSPDAKVITIGADIAADPKQFVQALAGIVGSVLNGREDDLSSQTAFVDRRLDTDGAGILNSILVGSDIFKNTNVFVGSLGTDAALYLRTVNKMTEGRELTQEVMEEVAHELGQLNGDNEEAVMEVNGVLQTVTVREYHAAQYEEELNEMF